MPYTLDTYSTLDKYNPCFLYWSTNIGESNMDEKSKKNDKKNRSGGQKMASKLELNEYFFPKSFSFRRADRKVTTRSWIEPIF